MEEPSIPEISLAMEYVDMITLMEDVDMVTLAPNLLPLLANIPGQLPSRLPPLVRAPVVAMALCKPQPSVFRPPVSFRISRELKYFPTQVKFPML